MRTFLVVGIILLTTLQAPCWGRELAPVCIENFIIRASESHPNKVEVVACDSLDMPLRQVNGDVFFNVNGFRQNLYMRSGVAALPQEIDQSTFLYVRHQADGGLKAKLYYLFKRDSSIWTVKVNSWVLMALPVLLIIVASIFRKLIVIAAMLFVAFFMFGATNGLTMSTWISTLLDGLKNLF